MRVQGEAGSPQLLFSTTASLTNIHIIGSRSYWGGDLQGYSILIFDILGAQGNVFAPVTHHGSPCLEALNLH